jgi:2-succinyl-5-enolpyruvyl-6-hydroxy-3-cyclohexene-1-carboxylate synthase
VVIITTSGTAVAELLPAVIEAFYQNLPLIIISADRPKSYRGCGSPQSIEHVGIFSSYVESVFDWDIHASDFVVEYSNLKPIHFNLCFDEPLIDGHLSEAKSSVQVTLKSRRITSGAEIKIKNPVAIVSLIKLADRYLVCDFLIQNKIIHYAEFLSGLRNLPELNHLQIKSSDYFIKNIFSKKTDHSILRIGGIPTLRFWRDLEFEFKNTNVFSFSDTEFSGLSRPSQLHCIQDLKNISIGSDMVIDLSIDQMFEVEKNKLLTTFEMSEQSVISKLSKHIQQKPLYIGNSLPIRTWDGFSSAPQTEQQVCANRGANGIDGQISTYLGWAGNKTESWCVVGDLTALYDLASLGLINQKLSNSFKNKYRICVINNSGGQIFSRLFGNQKYLNAQKVNFKSWAEMWGWDYLKISDPFGFEKLSNIESDQIIIEVVPDNNQTKSFWQNWDQLVK